MSVAYTVEVTTSARKELRRLDPQVRRQVEAVITDLVSRPRPDGVKKLSGRQHVYRISVARDWRVVYEIHDGIVTVVIIAV